MKLPKIKKIVIKNFSLYKSKNQIAINLADGVMCLAGANGLGKSTFISIVSYAMTGYVIQPGRPFKSENSIAAFVKRNAGFAYKYFEGRISEGDRDLATVTIEFELAGYTYKLTRGFFDSSELESFSRVGSDGQDTIDELRHLLEQYERFFTKDAGLASFDQFVFIQGFVLTFDESKKLLFWDADSMNRVMHLFFSLDPQKAQKADELRKDIKKCESRMRNIQWEISKANKQLTTFLREDTLSETEKANIEKAIKEEKTIIDEIDEKRDSLAFIDENIRETTSTIEDYVIQRYTLKTEYDETFSSLYQPDIKVEANPNILQYLKRIIVELTIDEKADVSLLMSEMKDEVVRTIKTKKVTMRQGLMDKLKDIDHRILETNKMSDELQEKRARLEKDKDRINAELGEKLNCLERFRVANDLYLKRRDEIYKAGKNSVDIDACKITIALKTKEKEDEERKRASYIELLDPIEEELKKTFSIVSDKFIPAFKSYAKSFIGMDIDINLIQVAGVLSMYVSVNGLDRKESFQLSESQQYFLDIALRFALIQYSQSDDAYMLIDTPEGSLDIAYESRAGQMFADFVSQGYTVIMTANINTSHLLLRMAEMCGKDRMKIERMTDWTTLSTVQQQEQDIIRKAFAEIEKNLESYAS